MTQSYVVGLASIVIAIYNLTLAILHIKIKHSVIQKVCRISYAASILLFFSVISITISYYSPRIGGYCLCQTFFSAALIQYILALFFMKFMYLMRIKVFNDEPLLERPYVGAYIKIVAMLLSILLIICIYLMIFHTNAECFDGNLAIKMNEYGCLTSFDTINLEAALIMIFVDGILFAMFCYKWYKIVRKLKPSQTGNKIPKQVWQGLAMQFICVIVAMISCSIDGVINFLYMDYDTLLVFIVDCAIVSTANFAMLKESQQFLSKKLRTILCIGIIYRLMLSEKKISTADTVISEPPEKNDNSSKIREGETTQQLPSEVNVTVNMNTNMTTQESGSKLDTSSSNDDCPKSEVSSTSLSQSVDSELP